MIKKLPFWVWFGGAMLAFAAGIMNVIGIMGIRGRGVSHVTGTMTGLGVEIGGDVDTHVPISLLAALVGAFFLGAVLSGALISDGALKVGRRYGLALLLETCLILLAEFLLDRGRGMGVIVLAFACGLQNAMISTFSGAAVRTTHMTGTLTDLGVAFGHILRGQDPPWRQISLLSCLIAGFILGGVVGGLYHRRFGDDLLMIPAIITWTLSLAYVIFARWTKTHHSGHAIDVSIEEPPAEATIPSTRAVVSNKPEAAAHRQA